MSLIAVSITNYFSVSGCRSAPSPGPYLERGLTFSSETVKAFKTGLPSSGFDSFSDKACYPLFEFRQFFRLLTDCKPTGCKPNSIDAGRRRGVGVPAD